MKVQASKRALIEQIRLNAEEGNFYEKTETGDPILTKEESLDIVKSYVRQRNTATYKMKRAVALRLARAATKRINRDTVIVGAERIPADLGGVLITSNHFSPEENTVIRHLVHSLGRRRLGIVCQSTNFAFGGMVGFLMNYADTIPVCADPHYLAHDFYALLRERLVEQGDAVLIYPEEELWYRYRKPRPPRNGAYFYASKLNVPILSCFVEIVDTNETENEEFSRVRHVLHVLGVLYPDPALPARENMKRLASEDYALKKACYERVYGKALSYRFEEGDIAGWRGAL